MRYPIPHPVSPHSKPIHNDQTRAEFTGEHQFNFKIETHSLSFFRRRRFKNYRNLDPDNVAL